jgi:uncharacterized protein YbjT (DUF2867 family)
MATLLIGGNGLVGTRLVRHLAEMGEQVIVYSGHAPAARSTAAYTIRAT